MSQEAIAKAQALKLDRNDAVLLIVDIQERLGAAMPQERYETLVKNTGVLLETAKTLGFPVITTEQYPRGLGPTIATLREQLREDEAPVEKLCFSCAESDEVSRRLESLGRKQVIVVGMETHVCVFQTVRDLAIRGLRPFVVADATSSRTAENHAIGLSLMKEAGAVITSTESALFDLLGVAGTPEFKQLSKLIK